jgi:uncharacterized phage protein gp47/JayE
MPFDRQPLEAIRERIKADLANKLAGANPRLRVNNLRVFAEVEAGATHLLFGRLQWNFRQLFPDLADIEQLIRWASIWGVRKSPATRAAGPATAIAQPSAFVQTGDLLQVEGGATQFRVRSSAFEQGGEINFTAEASDYGIPGNMPAGTVLRFLTTRTGVAPIATVSGNGLVGGADEDTDEQLLAALLRRIQQPPHGGNQNDYVTWMFEVSGITRAWCYPLEQGLGTVVLRFMMDDVRAADGGIPTNGDSEFVWNYIDLQRPVTADLGPDESLELPPPSPPSVFWGWGYVFPPSPVAAPVIIGGLEPDTLEVHNAIAAELADMIRHETEPGVPLQLNSYYLAIGNAPGVRRFRLDAPAAAVQVRPGEIVTLGPISYVT